MHTLSSLTTFAHEVYVLSEETIDRAMTRSISNIFQPLVSGGDIGLFITWTAIIAVIVVTALTMSFMPALRKLGKVIDKSSGWAQVVIRLAFGLSLILSAANGALYGPELPLESFPYASILSTSMVVIGIGLILGFQTRLLATLSIGLWLYALFLKGPYLLTYINYAGEALALILLPVTKLSLDGRLLRRRDYRFAAYSLPVARIFFALSLIYTAVTIKFMTTDLPLQVVHNFDMTRYFPFDPMFVVLGAAMIEVLVGILFLFGILQRFTSALFLIVMTASVIFFGESVWPHLLIIALGIGLFMHKPDQLTVDSLWLWRYPSLKAALLRKPQPRRGRRLA